MKQAIKITVTTLVALGATLLSITQAAAADTKLNVIFMLADNVGYGDLGPYGRGELRGAPTPRIDQLAGEGLRLTNYLVEPACTPSRAALMTGQYSIRNGLSLIIIPRTPRTRSQRVRSPWVIFHGAGYATAIFGKWHLGIDPQSLPTAHGFDEFYGYSARRVMGLCSWRRLLATIWKRRPSRDDGDGKFDRFFARV
jgi:arylsulfatase A-like enzyme